MGSNETGLKNRIGSDFLIGCYGTNEKGTGVFTDIRGEEGDLVENPVDDSLELSIAYNKETLETGVFYSFRWHLEDDDMSNIKYRMTAIINGEAVTHEISQKQYDKFLAVDDYHRM